MDAGLTCPNRDGTLGVSGCTFCSAGGSGDFAVRLRPVGPAHKENLSPGFGTFPYKGQFSIKEQLDQGKSLFRTKNTGRRIIAYFQAYTNTYGPLPYLETIYREALRVPETAGISIATRPDCLPDAVLNLLDGLRAEFPDKFIWVELGLQTVQESTAKAIRRGYPLSCFTDACRRLSLHRFPAVAHVILGLPGETREMMFDTVRHLNTQPIWGVKLQLLHVLRGTDLAADYEKGAFDALALPAYLDLVTDCLARLSPDIVIHRLTGDGPKDLLIAPLWSLDKRNVLNSLHKLMKRNSIRQGIYYESGTHDPL